MLTDENEISYVIIGAAIEVHRTLGGPGLLESVYEESLELELKSRGLTVRRQVPVVLRYKGTLLENPLRLDMLVNDKVIVECKSVITYNPVFESQALTYLRVSGHKLALVINFGAETIKEGIHRVLNG